MAFESTLLTTLSDPRLLAELSTACGNRTMELLQEEFDTSTDPYSSQWKPNKKGTQTLVDTGELRSGFQLQADETGFTITNSTHYGPYHQTGTSKMVQRKIIPTHSLPDKWSDAYLELFHKLFGGLDG